MLTRPPLVLDTDVLSCFAWIRRIDVLESLYSTKMLVPEQVIREISKINHLKAQVDLSIANGHMSVVSIDPVKPEGQEYVRLLTGDPPIGRGEAAVLSYVKHHGGTITSNNLTDVLEYSVSNQLPLLSVRAIFYEGIVDRETITLEEAAILWRKMIQKQRYLPCSTIEEAVAFYTSGAGASLTLQRY